MECKRGTTACAIVGAGNCAYLTLGRVRGRNWCRSGACEKRLFRESGPRGRIRLRATRDFDHLACARFRGRTVSTCSQNQLTWTVQATPDFPGRSALILHRSIQRIGVRILATQSPLGFDAGLASRIVHD